MIDHAPDHRFTPGGARTNVERLVDLAIAGAQHDQDPREAARVLVEAAGANRALLAAARNAAAQLAVRCEQTTFETAERFLQLAYSGAGTPPEPEGTAGEQVLDLRDPGSSTPGR